MPKNNEPKKDGFLHRVPAQLDASDFKDGSFLLSQEDREKALKEIEKNKAKNKAKNKTTFKAYDPNLLGPTVYLNDSEGFIEGPLLGRGGFGAVYAVQNLNTRKWFFMKKLQNPNQREPKKNDATTEELEILTEEQILTEEGMLHTFDSQTIIGELIHGRSLSQIIMSQKKRTKPFSFESALTLGISTLEAYESLHRKGYVHRDIKPDNVMVDSKRQKCIAIDFGLTVKKGEKTSAITTPLYAALEIYAGEKDEKGDFYSTRSLTDDIYSIGLTVSEIFSTSQPDSKNLSLSNEAKYKSRLDYAEKIDEARENAGGLPKKTNVSKNMHVGIKHVILGATSEAYQKEKKLSEEEIELYKILFDMTGEAKTRPTLSEALEKMRDIRRRHIEKNLEKIAKGNLKSALKELYNLRNSMIKEKNQPHLLDDMDSFLLTAMDSNNPDKNILEKVKKYTAEIKTTQRKKVTLLESIKDPNRPKLKNAAEEQQKNREELEKLKPVIEAFEKKYYRENGSEINALYAKKRSSHGLKTFFSQPPFNHVGNSTRQAQINRLETKVKELKKNPDQAHLKSLQTEINKIKDEINKETRFLGKSALLTICEEMETTLKIQKAAQEKEKNSRNTQGPP